MSEIKDRLSVALVVLEDGGCETVYYKEGLTFDQANMVSKLNGTTSDDDKKIMLDDNVMVHMETLFAWLIKPYHDRVFEDDENEMKENFQESGLQVRPDLCCLFGEGSHWKRWTMEGKNVDRLYFCKIY